MQAGFRLGIDFGTSHTVAVLRWPDGRVKPLLFDGSSLLPSAVAVEADGRFAVGRDALHSARTDPGRCEPNPKRRIDEGSVLLGDREVPVAEAIAAVLAAVAREAYRTAGAEPAEVTLTYPAAWASPRRQVLGAAAALAGLGKVRLVEEPVAAATYFAHTLAQRTVTGSVVVVFDFGGGTFDVSLVERLPAGFRTLAVDGLDEFGGLDLDEALIRWIGHVYGRLDRAAWRRLSEPATVPERRAWRQFRDDVRVVKERLSRHPTADLHIPVLDRDVHMTRDEFEQVAQPLLDETVRLTESVIRRSGVAADRLAGVFLVGGSSRIPLVATQVHRRLGIAPTVIEQPELVVAEGSILVERIVATAALPTSPTVARPPEISSVPAEPDPAAEGATRGRRSRRRLLAGALAGLAALAAAVVALNFWPGGGTGAEPVPVACAAVAPEPGAASLAPGTPQPERFQAFENQHWYVDPSGFRLMVPDGWKQRLFPGGVCFTEPDGEQYVGVTQWRQSDTNLVDYWQRRSRAVELTGYKSLSIGEKKDLHDAAAVWGFEFVDDNVRFRAGALALISSGDRAYAVVLCMPASEWVQDDAAGDKKFALFDSTFLPAT